MILIPVKYSDIFILYFKEKRVKEKCLTHQVYYYWAKLNDMILSFFVLEIHNIPLSIKASKSLRQFSS